MGARTGTHTGMTLAQHLTDFALGDITPTEDAQAMIRLSCLDWAACALAGQDEPLAKILRTMALDDGGREDATLIGGGRGPARVAALTNGAISHALDYDDTHFAHIGHPSVAVFPAALAQAEKLNRPMVEMLEAALIGVEASIRVGLWLGRAHYQVGFHQTATAGAFGATLAAARLAGLDAKTCGHALGLAATKAAGIKAQFGTMGKPLNAGLAAECGVMAADWAAQGLRSTPDALDGTNGFGATHHGANDASAFDGLGQTWSFETVSHKFHAYCHGLHASLEALRAVEGVPGKIDIRTHPRWMTVCNIETPTNGLEAKFSYRMVTAMALSGIDTAKIENFNDALTTRADLAALMLRVTVTADDTLSETEAEIRTSEGTHHHDLAAPMDLNHRKQRIETKAAALTPDAAKLQTAIQTEDIAAFKTALFN